MISLARELALMLALALVLALVGCASTKQASITAPSGEPMDMAPGEVRIVTHGVREYGLKGTGVIDVRASGETLTITAVALGETMLYLVDHEGHVTRVAIRVVPRHALPVPLGHELAQRLIDYRCIRLLREGPSWVIVGSAESDEERLTLAQLADDYASRNVVLRLGPNGCPDAG